MTPRDCPFESEVLAAVLEGRWASRAESELAAHAAACPICAEVAAIAQAMDESRHAGAPPLIPDSGRVWWLAQRRARLEAAELANRPIVAARVVALACVIGLVCAYFNVLTGWLQAAFDRIAWGSAPRLFAEHAGLALAMALVVLLLPAAAWLAMGRK